ncbi:MAG: hypothetical protein NTW87_31915 [Planctomycetota bacterium]|nr:hypothetical protein [Planctomycetota bacterium]
MPSSPHESAACTCGQVVFDVSGRKVGAILSCPWCKKEYRYLGGEVIRVLEPGEKEAEAEERRKEREARREKASAKEQEPAKEKEPEQKTKETHEAKQEEDEAEDDKEPELETEEDEVDDPGMARVGLAVVAGSEEVFRHEVPDKAGAASDVSSRMKKHAAKRKRKRPAAEAPTEGRASPSGSPQGKTNEIPGGAFRMIAFIVLFNAAFLIVLNVVFRLQPDGRRTTPWGWMIPAWKVPWPELITLFLGHLCAFVAWAWNVYGLQKRLKAQAEADAAAAKEEKKTGESQRARSAKEKDKEKEKEKEKDKDKDAAKAEDRPAKKTTAKDREKEAARDDEDEADDEEDDDDDSDGADADSDDGKPARKQSNSKDE